MGKSCHGATSLPSNSKGKTGKAGAKRIFLVGSPNVGKSVLFNALTGTYAVVSNYPGTTVEVSRGKFSFQELSAEVIDTPGMYSLHPITEEERVARDILLQDEGPIIHVVDAKNLPRMLPMTLELSQLGRPLVLVCNLMDEASRLGVRVDTAALQEELGIPVIAMIATRGEGLLDLKKLLAEGVPLARPPVLKWPAPIRQAVQELKRSMKERGSEFWALRHLEGDELAARIAPAPESVVRNGLNLIGGQAGRERLPRRLSEVYRSASRAHLKKAFSDPGAREGALQEKIDRILINPWSGFPILGLVLFLGLYELVGVFGAQTLVNLLENDFFLKFVNPLIERFFGWLVPWEWLRSLFVGQYGMLTLGLRYAVAIVLPIVFMFFLVFSVLEDSGYLPRLAMMLNRIFRKIGLNGRAVIPLILGFGCDTMATMVTRTLETKRERLIATFLLALAIPCSAQLGLIMALLAGHPAAMVLWVLIVTGVFLAAGSLLAKLMPGEKPFFFMELPPLRVPSPKNVLSKTVNRMGWYLFEVVPLFMLASALIWVGQITGLFPKLIKMMEPVVKGIGLPPQTAVAFLFGFFRRDYGAAGLFELQKTGLLNGTQLLVAAVTLTLFLPCIAQFLMMKKERGWATTLTMSAVILLMAFGIGWTLNTILVSLGVTL
ncbi:MAG: ferrous iron transport protein B [Acidobacteriota bacterium]|jgi:ferrous iron transport protein B